jgi:hypothetical protein
MENWPDLMEVQCLVKASYDRIGGIMRYFDRELEESPDAIIDSYEWGLRITEPPQTNQGSGSGSG